MYVLLALGVFLVVDLTAFGVQAPAWMWRIFQAVLGILSVILEFGLGSWYLGLGVAGGAVLIQRVADALLVYGSTHR